MCDVVCSMMSRLRAFRVQEILLMTGFSFVGALFTEPNGWSLWNVSSAALAILFYVMAVFFLNSFADHAADATSQRLSHVARVPRRTYFILLLSAAASVMLFSALNSHRLLILMLVSLLLWSLYYFPPIHLKSRLLGGTFAHLAGGMLHFQMGYIGFGMSDTDGWWISAFFAFILAAGHFNHEMMDHDADRTSGFQTTTVRWGLNAGKWLRTFFSALSVCWAALLFQWQIWSFAPFAAFVLASIAMTVASAALSPNNVKLFQRISRRLFLAAGMTVVAVRLWALLT